jgi:hypothetical protein
MIAARKPADGRLLLYLACLGAGTAAAVFLYPVTMEDAFITFHYARAFAAGKGIGIWNAGQAPVEGFSSMVWMLLMGCGERLGWSPLVLSKALGYVSYVGTSALFLIASRRRTAEEALGEDNALALYLVAVVAALFLPLIYYSISGMEATLYGLEVAAALLTPMLVRGEGGRAVWASAAGAALVATRPEGIVAAVAIFGCWLWVSRGKGVWAGTALGWAVAVVVAMTAYRWHHFGELVPNTYFAKATGGTVAHRLALGLHYDGSFLVGVAPFTVVFAVGAVGVATGRIRGRLAGVALGLFGFYAACILKVGGDAAGAFPLWRQFDQIAPVWMLFAALTIAALVRGGRRAILCAVAVVLAADAEVVARGRYLLVARQWELLREYGPLHVEPPNPYFVWLRQFSTPESVTAVLLAGQWPYYVPGRSIDSLGLNDRWIAKHGHVQATSDIVDSKSDMGYVLGQRPEMIDGYSSGLALLRGDCPLSERARTELVDAMKNDPGFRREYVFVRNAPYGELDRALYFRRDFAARFGGRLDTVAVTETSLYRAGCAIE